MIQWVDEHCRAWGAHKRWLMLGTNHGWPSEAVIGRLMREGPGAGHGSFRHRVPVRDSPPAYREINAALLRMADTHAMENAVNVVMVHYLLPGRASVKAPMVKLALSKYWAELHAAHAFISACVEMANQPSESAVS